MTKPLLFAMFLGLFAAGCASESADANGGGPAESATSNVIAADTCSALSPRTTPLELFVQPDVGTAPFVETLSRATTSIDVMVYQMGYGPILDTLLAKAQAGVRVRAILDLAQAHVNQKYKDKLEAAGATVIFSNPKFTFTHAKFLVVDGNEAIVSTGNYNVSYMTSERNYAVRDRDAADIASLKAIFEADFAGTDPDLSCTRLVVAPVNARQRLLDLINSATTTLVVESMQFGDRDVRDAVVARKNAGVDVRVILADPSWIDANASAATFLEQNGITPKYYPHAHVKSIVVDGKAAYVGSVNLSWNSIDKNREVGLVVTEPANIASMLGTFEHDWTTGTDFTAAPAPAPDATSPADQE